MSSVPFGVKDMFRTTRLYLSSNNTITAGSPFLAAVNLTQAGLPSSFTQLAALYDLLRINSVKIRWIPRFNVNTSVTAGDDELPQIAFYANYDDFAAPASVDSVLSAGNVRMTRFDREMSLTVKPVNLTPTPVTVGSPPILALLPADTWYNAGAFTAYPTIWPLAKYAITSTTATPANGHFDVYFTLDVTFAQRLC
jgi:hypothetical protein